VEPELATGFDERVPHRLAVLPGTEELDAGSA
jgi:hypothetical protein